MLAPKLQALVAIIGTAASLELNTNAVHNYYSTGTCKAVRKSAAGIDSSVNENVPASACGKRIIGYIDTYKASLVTTSQLEKITHAIYTIVKLDENGIFSFKEGAEEEERFNKLRETARKANPGISILFGFAGWYGVENLAKIASDKSKKETLVNSIAEFIEKYELDGVEVDWEFPFNNGNGQGSEDDKDNLLGLVRDVRERLTALQKQNKRQKPYILCITGGREESTILNGYDLPEILKLVDFINVLTADYFGAFWKNRGVFTGPNAPLYSSRLNSSYAKLDVDYTMKMYSCLAGKPSQLNMVVPFSGRYWNEVGDAIEEDYPLYRIGAKGIGQHITWKDLKNEEVYSTAVYDERTKTPFIFDKENKKYYSFDNEKSMQEKVKYAIDKNFGGIAIMYLNGDDEKDSLLNIVSNAELCSQYGKDEVKYPCPCQ